MIYPFLWLDGAVSYNGQYRVGPRDESLNLAAGEWTLIMTLWPSMKIGFPDICCADGSIEIKV